MAGKKILLLLDDAAGHEQVRPLLPGTAGSLVLVTSRRRLTALDDSAIISLGGLSPGEGATLLARLAARPGVRAVDAAAGEITRLCGYLPLAIGMLARQLSQHPAWTAGDLAASLAAARDRLAAMRAENLSVAAAFDLSYADLTPGRQQLFRRLGLIPGPSFDAYAAAALDDISLDQARRSLEDLYDQHLITEPAPSRYLLHDLLREHARTLVAAGNPADTAAAAGRLLDYYLHTAVAASQHHFSKWAAGQDRLPPGQPPAHAPPLAAAEQAAAWLETERPNLHAAADYAAASGQHLYAIAIAAAIGDFLHGHGHWDQAAALHLIALTSARQAGDRPGQARALRELGAIATLTGDLPAAAASLTRAAALYRDLGDQSGQVHALNDLGHLHTLTGDYPAATAAHQRTLALGRGSGDQFAEAAALNCLGWVQQLTGEHQGAAANLASALDLYRGLGHRLGEAEALADLGRLQRLTGDYPAAATSVRQALELFRGGGDRLGETDALYGLGMVQQVTGDYPAAAASLQQSLKLCHALGFRLGQAEALNGLGELSSRTSASRRARDQHTEALAIARDLGVPLEEARALEGIGRSHLQDGNRGQAAAHLRQALTIYQRIGAPLARQVQETVRHHKLHHRDNLHGDDKASKEA